MIRYFRIAKMNIKIESDGVEVQKELDDFEISETDEYDIEISITRDRFGYAGKSFADYVECTIIDESDFYLVNYKNWDMVHGYRLSKTDNKAIIYVDKYGIDVRNTRDVEFVDSSDHMPTAGEYLSSAIKDCVMYFAQKKGYVAIHASSLIYNDRLYAFCAESGGGKSTHMENWIKAGIDCEKYNGDVLLLKSVGDKVISYGIPWCGTSKIYSTKEIELAGLFFVIKSEKNCIKEIEKIDQVIKLNARSFSPNWEKKFVAMNVEACKKIASAIHVCDLYCTKDENSAFVVKDYIEGGMNR